MLALITGGPEEREHAVDEGVGLADPFHGVVFGEGAIKYSLELAAGKTPAARRPEIVDGAMVDMVGRAGLDKEIAFDLETADGERAGGFSRLEAHTVEEHAVAAHAAGRAKPGGGTHERG